MASTGHGLPAGLTDFGLRRKRSEDYVPRPTGGPSGYLGTGRALVALVFIGVALAQEMPKESGRFLEPKVIDVDVSIGGIPIKVVID